ncbi:MAG: FecR domain-containing protein, partial [Planctomycetota bacterium]
AAVVPGWCDDEGNVRFGTTGAFRGALRPGSAFRVPRDAALVLSPELGDPPSGTRCEVSGPAVFCVEAGAPGREFRCSLHEGELSAEVAQLAGGQRFSVATPHARVRVVGTKFRVAVCADETRVAVAEGLVALESANPEGSLVPWSETVLAGEGRWTVRRGELPAREVAAAPAPNGPESEPVARTGSEGTAASPEKPAGAGLPSEASRPTPSPSGPRPGEAGLDLPVEPQAPEPPED